MYYNDSENYNLSRKIKICASQKQPDMALKLETLNHVRQILIFAKK